MSADDISPLIVAKSDQLNADDLVGGPITVRILGATITPGDQPVTVEIDGGHKPWKPCKTTMRVLAALWGPHPSKWVGRTVRLFRDPAVKWGGVEVGGIRISGMSHIDKPQSIMLASKKGAKAAQRVDVIKDAARERSTHVGDTPENPVRVTPAPADMAPTGNAPTLDEMRDDLVELVGTFGCAPSSFREFAQARSGKTLPPVGEWDGRMLDWALRGLRNGLAAPFMAFLAGGEA